MNYFDTIIGILLVIGLVQGARKGLVVELAGILGLIAGAWLAYLFSAQVGDWLGLPPYIAREAAFVGIMVVVLVVILIAGRLLSRAIDFAGLGLINRMLGAVVSVLKVGLILSLLLVAFDAANRVAGWVKPSQIEESKLYRPVLSLTGLVFPYIRFETLDQWYRVPGEYEQQHDPDREVPLPETSPGEETMPPDTTALMEIIQI